MLFVIRFNDVAAYLPLPFTACISGGFLQHLVLFKVKGDISYHWGHYLEVHLCTYFISVFQAM